MVKAFTYKKSSIITSLNNLSIGPGDRIGAQVKRGNLPRYEKISQALFSLADYDITLDTVVSEETPDFDVGNGQKEKKGKSQKSFGLTKPAIYNDFVDYLSSKPFRIFFGRQNWYPETSAVGWYERLNVYAWPLRTRTPVLHSKWPATTKKLKSFTNRINKLLNSNSLSVSDQEKEALTIYEDIKAWGNPRGAIRSGDVILEVIKSVY